MTSASALTDDDLPLTEIEVALVRVLAQAIAREIGQQEVALTVERPGAVQRAPGTDAREEARTP